MQAVDIPHYLMDLVDTGRDYPQIYPAQIYLAHQLSVLVESVVFMICALEAVQSLVVLAVVQYCPFGVRRHLWVILGPSITMTMS